MKKIIAPLIITVLILIYLVLYFAVIIFALPGLFLKLLLAIIPLSLGGTMVYVCIQRINEIRSGEEDDLSKY